MCDSKKCSRKGCENPVPDNRKGDFCSNTCRKNDHILKLTALKDSYKELPISHAELLNNKKTTPKKICCLEGCSQPVSRRKKKTKFCSLKCAGESRRRKKLCSAIGCEKVFSPTRKKGKYCSRACYLKTVQPAEKFCLNKGCSKKLNLRLQEKFCSLKCCNEHKHGNIEWNDVCQRSGCNKELTDRRSSRTFCSQDCYKAHRLEKKNITGTIKLIKRKGWEYPRRFIKTESGWKMLSVFTWEKHNGVIPKNHMLIFKDGDSFNDEDINNIQLISNFENLQNKRKLKKTNEDTPVSNEMFSLKDSEI